ncbi:DUF4190 domain-containing protein [Leucobacter allii]|uniref:DUF4190 domain-containing protein n=1 Tax=Leucobacter allii TaxID=2932247 RepID=UPI001FCFEBBF|nr:DUF4190 domain-containing protein [Leucobacter allii]UOR02628.1 DUF4190 domain-containing protein [Leucobacter allii]
MTQQDPRAGQQQPYAQPGQYPQPQYQAQPPVAPQPQYLQQPAYYAVAAPTNVLATLSLIASIVGFFSFAILSIAGIVMGHISLSQIKRRGENGRGMAIAGLIIGYIGVAFWIVLIAFWLFILGAVVTAGAATSSYA